MALDALARREHGYFELERKLLSKGFEPSEVDEQLATLVSEGLLDDARFAEAYVHYRVQKGYGPNRIRAELRERGIDDAVGELALQAAEFDWASIIKLAWQKKFSGPPEDYQEKAKQARFLEYRGFSGDSIMRFLAEL